MGYKRRPTRKIKVGNIYIGGDSPITVQSMANTDTRDAEATIAQIKRLEEAGCELVRIAVVDMKACKNIAAIKSQISIPLIADIHFDYRLALEAVNQGIDAIRINPGNIGSHDRVVQVVNACKSKSIPIRIGVNGGSLEKDLLEKYNGATAEALAESAMRHVRILEDLDFYDIVISLKSSDIFVANDAYRIIAEKTDYPLHLGITEAGGVKKGTIKSAVGIGSMLMDGIGDTLRVSLTGDPVEEVDVGKEILRSLDLLNDKIKVISCPTCGRCNINLIEMAEKIEREIADVDKNIKVAIMGCAVNGPGEARDADIGIAGGNNSALLFKKGEVVRKLEGDKIIEDFVKEIKSFE